MSDHTILLNLLYKVFCKRESDLETLAWKLQIEMRFDVLRGLCNFASFKILKALYLISLNLSHFVFFSYIISLPLHVKT